MAPLEEFDREPDLVARVHRRIHGTAGLPLVTLLTLGIVPSSVEEEWGWSFALCLVRASSSIVIECTHTGRSTLGWVSLVDGLLPGRTPFPFAPDDSRRMRDRLALAILERSGEIERVLKE